MRLFGVGRTPILGCGVPFLFVPCDGQARSIRRTIFARTLPLVGSSNARGAGVDFFHRSRERSRRSYPKNAGVLGTDVTGDLYNQ